MLGMRELVLRFLSPVKLLLSYWTSVGFSQDAKNEEACRYIFKKKTKKKHSWYYEDRLILNLLNYNLSHSCLLFI